MKGWIQMVLSFIFAFILGSNIVCFFNNKTFKERKINILFVLLSIIYMFGEWVLIDKDFKMFICLLVVSIVEGYATYKFTKSKFANIINKFGSWSASIFDSFMFWALANPWTIGAVVSGAFLYVYI